MALDSTRELRYFPDVGAQDARRVENICWMRSMPGSIVLVRIGLLTVALKALEVLEV